jgi:hypothetical protein
MMAMTSSEKQARRSDRYRRMKAALEAILSDDVTTAKECKSIAAAALNEEPK